MGSLVRTDVAPNIEPTSRPLPNGLIESTLGNTKVILRESDGWIKVSSISVGRRDWPNWYRNQGENLAPAPPHF